MSVTLPPATTERALPHPPATNLRSDLQVIADLVPARVKALDIGCGNGELLEYLVRQKQVMGRGIELSETGVLACVRRGLSVRQGKLQEGMADYPDVSFDYVILSQTLPFLSDPQMILQEMLRIGKKAIVSIPNWGYWRCRLSLLTTGRIPLAPDLPQPWYASPRMQAFTITDFAHFCTQINIRICEEIYLSHSRRIQIRKFKTLMATTAVFALEKV
ncbi:MAG: methionine biosynthesis protein MetW [Chloroflexi bacterium]|nr:methionine biosynthesis protein MetW [Chloroflexota bacterium]